MSSIPASYPINVLDAVIFGSDANSQVTNANVNKYDYIYFEVTNFSSARAVRVLFWDPSQNKRIDNYLKPVAEKETADYAAKTTVSAAGTYCVRIPSGARLQGAKTPWIETGATEPYFKFSEIYVIEPADPLAGLKDLLQQTIDKGNEQNSFAKTTASWNALQTAISNGAAELENASTTAELLTAATTAINNAINGLVLQDGYTNLTKEMANNTVDYVLNSSTGLAYGTAGVDMNTYAELNEFDQFIVLASVGMPRFCMNRLTSGGQIGADLEHSEMIDINPNNEYTWATTKYQTIDGNKYTLDLKTISEEWNGLARLNCIKGAHYANVKVTDMLLYRTLNVGSTGYATFGSLYKNAKPNDVTAYAAKYEDGQVTLTPVTNVPAGKGVVIMGDEGSYAPTFDVEADDIDSDLKVSDGTVVGDESTIYVLANGASGIGFYLLKSGNKLAAGKAYLEIGGGSARAFVGISGMDVTGISTVKQAEGKKDDVIYNLNGQRVSNPRKGLFIKNGVKFLVD